MPGRPKKHDVADARHAAHRLLGDVLRHRRPLDDAFPAAVDGLAPRDRAFARLLTATVLRRLGEIDAVLARLMDTPLPRNAAAVTDALRLGVAQLLYLGTPAHAAVDGTVTLAGRNRAYRGLVNAVLRRLDRERDSLIADIDGPRLDMPAWLWDRLAEAYGETTARAVATAHLTPPPLDLSLKRNADAAAWAEKLAAIALPWGGLRRDAGGSVEDLPGYEAGAWWVQDAAAALPAKLLLDALGDPADQRVLDLCAAPGGKTAQLAAAGCAVTALDRSAARLDRLAANLERLGLKAAIVAADATSWRAAAPFAAVLLDAPCSATGTIRRHPDVAHLKNPEDVAKLSALQDRLLVAAAGMVAPGGVLLYCTCSLLPVEGEERMAAFLAGGAPFERVPVRPESVGGRSEIVNDNGDVRALPCHLAEIGGLDGFFISILRRRD